jgi:hypothetical protein
MANTQSSSPHPSPQETHQSPPATLATRTSVEQQLRLTVEAPQLLAAIEILLPLAKAQCRSLSGPRSSSCPPHIAQLIRSEADAWAMGIALADDALGRIKPYAHLLAVYFHRFEAVLAAHKAVQP